MSYIDIQQRYRKIIFSSILYYLMAHLKMELYLQKFGNGMGWASVWSLIWTYWWELRKNAFLFLNAIKQCGQTIPMKFWISWTIFPIIWKAGSKIKQIELCSSYPNHWKKVIPMSISSHVHPPCNVWTTEHCGGIKLAAEWCEVMDSLSKQIGAVSLQIIYFS